MRTQYTQELESLHTKLAELGNAANESVHKAIKAYTEFDKELAHELFSDDLRINASTVDIERDAYRLIVLQQPVSEDLRLIFAIIHASLDIERIADHAVSIARAVIRRETEAVDVEVLSNKIKRMGEIIQPMLTDTIAAFAEKDAEAAREIAERDELVDELLRDVFIESQQRMVNNSEVVEQGVSYINVAQSLERIGDYVTNICERIVYIVTGDIVELN
ncbi:phosphate signaling complex protein PhoU [Fundicoccus culcitae]|uniref:Phosphate-specific transport system accessory protein PhoU n=1 Tax=Fundicoccus culcitae TaxID=2969821 RepID=A0ABY5P2P9_9LACT|nr:phosphate signaling complex protein PhoU [Fundicoccus culcitae]UUX32929.1 phosphate signaling complex protein PhoU [Fundicoccus culcitae]